MPDSFAEKLLLFLKGMAMGAADSVPGVSGGTIAFITGIYDELIHAICAVNFSAVRTLFRAGPAAAWQQINGSFLLLVALGMIVALALSSQIVLWLLEHHYSYLMCFFSGLILASLLHMRKRMLNWQWPQYLLALAGLIFVVLLSTVPQQQGSDSLPYLFMSGAVAICAMLLPGISGAFILILLGAYEPVLGAIGVLNLPVLAVFLLGCLGGLLSFSRLIDWLLRTHRQHTLAVLLGVLAGSLYTLWPWRQAFEGQSSVRNLGPGAYDIVTGAGLSLVLAAVLALAGFMLVLGLELLSSKFSDKSISSSH